MRNNRIVMDPATPIDYAPIHMTNCENVTIDGLTVSDSRNARQAVIQAPGTSRTKVTMNRLAFDVPAGMKEALFAGEE